MINPFEVAAKEDAALEAVLWAPDDDQEEDEECDTAPADGTEYLRRVRREAAKCQPVVLGKIAKE